MTAFYNEHDPKAAAWLRELIKQGHIAPGVVDERSIIELTPKDLDGYTQCHFFAGIGVWSYALRCAGWPDDRPVWTGSCPCQPFSAAGKGDEFADERHLWPSWFRLICECKPDAIFGEQVASKDALAWFDHVSTDLEGEGYAVGAVDTCAAGYGAPHIRQRLYFVADSKRRTAERHGYELGSSARGMQGEARQQRIRNDIGHGVELGELADSANSGYRNERDNETGRGQFERGGIMGDTDKPGPQGRRGMHECTGEWATRSASMAGILEHANIGNARTQTARSGRWQEYAGSPSATNGFWSAAEWIACRDGKARPVEPGTFPLAHGSPARVGRLRGYGNAIVAPQAEEFVRTFMECAA